MFRKTLNILIVTSTFAFQFSFAGNHPEENKDSQNPFLNHFNTLINYSTITADEIKSATDITIENAKKSLEKIYNIEKDKRNFENTALAFDDIYNDLSSVEGPIYLMANVHPDNDIRNTSNSEISVFSKFFNDLTLDEKLYIVFRQGLNH